MCHDDAFYAGLVRVSNAVVMGLVDCCTCLVASARSDGGRTLEMVSLISIGKREIGNWWPIVKSQPNRPAHAQALFADRVITGYAVTAADRQQPERVREPAAVSFVPPSALCSPPLIPHCVSKPNLPPPNRLPPDAPAKSLLAASSQSSMLGRGA